MTYLPAASPWTDRPERAGNDKGLAPRITPCELALPAFLALSLLSASNGRPRLSATLRAQEGPGATHTPSPGVFLLWRSNGNAPPIERREGACSFFDNRHAGGPLAFVNVRCLAGALTWPLPVEQTGLRREPSPTDRRERE